MERATEVRRSLCSRFLVRELKLEGVLSWDRVSERVTFVDHKRLNDELLDDLSLVIRRFSLTSLDRRRRERTSRRSCSDASGDIGGWDW